MDHLRIYCGDLLYSIRPLYQPINWKCEEVINKEVDLNKY